MKDIIKNVSKVVIGAMTILLTSFCASTVFNWVIVPQFGVKTISIAAMFGIFTLLGFFKSKTPVKDERKFSDKMGSIIIIDLILLLGGYVVHLSM